MMKKLFAGSLLVTLLAASTVFAAERPPVPAKGTEGPDVRASQSAPSTPPVPVKGIEGPGIR
jgi:hypothetical protein